MNNLPSGTPLITLTSLTVSTHLTIAPADPKIHEHKATSAYSPRHHKPTFATQKVLWTIQINSQEAFPRLIPESQTQGIPSLSVYFPICLLQEKERIGPDDICEPF